MSERVWYASYGSNLSRSRFECYLYGGRPLGASRTYPGARDRTPPTGDRALILPGQVYFAWQSPTWGGGVAFYDPAADGEVAARAYLLTVPQFSDVATQEMHRPTGADVDVHGLLAHAPVATLGPGRYETLHRVAELDGVAVVTFSAPWTLGDALLNAPSPAYLRMMADGLREAHGWSDTQVAAYLDRCPPGVPIDMQFG